MSQLGVAAFAILILGICSSIVAWSWIPVTIGAGLFFILACIEAGRRGGPVRKGGDDGPPS